MRTKSKTCLKSTHVSNSILEKRMNLRKVLPKANSANFNNTSPNHLKNNITNKGPELQQQSTNFKELEFILNKDNPTIVEYYTNNSSKDNNNICFLNYYPYYWNSYENGNGTSELVQKRKRLFNKEEFWKEFARKVDDLNRSSPSNYCAKISANDSNSSYIHHSNQNINESKSPFFSSAYNNANNYCPHFSQSASNDTECFKASTNNNSNIESTTVSISQALSESPQQYSSQKKSEETDYRESFVVSPTPLSSESNHHQIYQPSSIAPIFHHYSSSTDSPPSSTQPFSLPFIYQQQQSSFSDSQYNSYQLYRQSLFFHHPLQTESDYFSKQIQPNTSKNSEFNAGNATSCLYCDLYFE